MIGNIAHQWRQPLNVISASSSSVILQKELGILDDKLLDKSYKNINKNVKFLSQTIDDFRNFIEHNGVKEKFLAHELIDSFLVLNDSSISKNNIKVILDIEDNLLLNTYKNELIQCLLNIFNNSIDALNHKNILTKYLFISITSTKDNIIISIKDNALGIPKDIINKIFQPYFTTKQQSKGTGLGLFMTHKLIKEGLKGIIQVTNKNYIHDNKEFKGALFKITLNKT
jgi:signal transduction histidine kinase